MTKAGMAGWVVAAFVAGGLVGLVTFQWISREHFSVVIAAKDVSEIRNNVVVLKLLDDGRIEDAKTFLVANLSASLKSPVVTPESLGESEMGRNLKQSMELARRGLADRSKSYEQLQKESQR